ncbi:MAG TPA: molybdopterin cofactor-binding domain-containing protein [Casimicrobiaceae bacterium]|nr:molybdopterin cofactor-binding domain-containing protein [Casimicrobiaceae bacterium]
MTLPAEILAGASAPAMDRRGFLTIGAKGLVVAFAMPLVGRSAAVQAAATPPTAQQLANAYVHVGTDGSIVLWFGGSEMGQGAMSGLAQILAEELMVDWNQVTVKQAGVDPIVSYLTGGSSAVSRRYVTLRNAAAAARELLIAAAMTKTGDANRGNYAAKSATVVYTNPVSHAVTSWPYSALATLAASQTVPADLRLTDPGSFRLIGQPVPRVDIPSKVDGSAKYGIDTWMPNMVFAAIKHCPVIGGTLASTPATPSGAIAVVPCKASDTRGAVTAGTVNAVAVVASNTWLAMNLANGLSVSWKMPASTAGVDSAAILSQAQGLMASGQALCAEPVAPAGTTPAAYASAIEPTVKAALGTPTIDATYTLPYLAHATMEVVSCAVNIVWSSTGVAQSCEIWAPTQAAAWTQATAAGLTGLPASQITVHTTLLGGGLGRKIEQDYVSQAVQVAIAVKKPVKLTWRREEDFAHDQYRPFALVNVKAKLASGKIAAWSYRNVSQAILGQRGWLPPGAVDSQATEGSTDLPYDLGTHIVEWVPLPAGIPVGFWRSVGSSINAFAVESMIDELARAAGADPFQFRYANMTDARALAVLQAADSLSLSWRNSLPAGHAWGVAIAESFGTWVAQVVDISQPVSGSIKVNRIACVVDCGTVINPNSVEAQMQGGIVHAMNAALWGEMTFAAGKAAQLNFNRYRMMKINDMPQITVQIIKSTNPPSGIGEPGVPPLAPALANAYARLTGVRVRTLPFFPGSGMSDD